MLHSVEQSRRRLQDHSSSRAATSSLRQPADGRTSTRVFTLTHLQVGVWCVILSLLLVLSQFSRMGVTYTFGVQPQPGLICDQQQVSGDVPSNTQNPTTSTPAALTQLADGLTVMVPTFRRQERVLYNLACYYSKLAALPFVTRIIFSWNDVSRKPHADLLAALQSPEWRDKAFIQYHTNNSLLNRYNVDEIHTAAVLSMDDDVCIDVTEVTAMYKLWLQSPYQIVGSFLRFAGCTNNTCKYSHVGTPGDEHPYNLLLPGGGVISHRDNYVRIWDDSYAGMRDEVESKHNGEDLLFNWLLRPQDGPKRLLGHAKFNSDCKTCGADRPAKQRIEEELNSLSVKKTHMTDRNDLSTSFHKASFGHVPLPVNTSLISSARPSDMIWEQFRIARDD